MQYVWPTFNGVKLNIPVCIVGDHLMPWEFDKIESKFKPHINQWK